MLYSTLSVANLSFPRTFCVSEFLFSRVNRRTREEFSSPGTCFPYPVVSETSSLEIVETKCECRLSGIGRTVEDLFGVEDTGVVEDRTDVEDGLSADEQKAAFVNGLVETVDIDFQVRSFTVEMKSMGKHEAPNRGKYNASLYVPWTIALFEFSFFLLAYAIEWEDLEPTLSTANL